LGDREELQALRRLAELEAKAGGGAAPMPQQQQQQPQAQPGFLQNMLNVFTSPQTAGGPMAMTGREGLRQGGELLERGAYSAGGDVTDVASGMGASPEVAGGAGFAANVGVQAIPTLLGAGAGRAAQPAVTAPFKWAGKKIRNIADPWLPGGVDRAVGRTAIEAAGPQRQAVIEALKQNKQIVPGSMPTAGEAAAPAGSAEFSGLQNVITGKAPSAYFAKAGQQEAARVAALRGVGKTPADVTAAETARAATTGPMREAALKQANIVGVSTQKLMRQIRGVESQPGIRASDVVRKSLADVKEKIAAFTNKDGFINSKDLYTIRKELGNTIKTHAKETSNWDKRLTSGLERDLQKNIDDAIEAAGGVGWKDYLSTYRKMSEPINRMQVGQELEKSLTSALGTAERPAAFATALRNAPQTLKRATGQPRYEALEEVLEPSQTKAVTNVLEDLKRTALHEQLAKAGTEKARDLVGQISPALPQAGMFNPKYSVLRAISNRLAGRVEGKSLDRLAEAMQDPVLMAKLMQSASPAERAALVKALGGPRVAGTTAGALGGAGIGYESGRSP
jgi:hypothetical protein